MKDNPICKDALPVIHSRHACENFILLNFCVFLILNELKNIAKLGFSFHPPPAAYRFCVMCDVTNVDDADADGLLQNRSD